MKDLRIDDIPFMVIDFETITPKGIPPEPIQIGLVEINKLEVNLLYQRSWFIKLPFNLSITPFDTAQTGIKNDDLACAKTSNEIFDILESICKNKDYIFIAQNASYELNICKRYYSGRDSLSSSYFIDTIKLAKIAFPNEQSYKLDKIANILGIDIPESRHTALTDCLIAGQIFIKLVKKLDIKTKQDLLDQAGINYIQYKQSKLF